MAQPVHVEGMVATSFFSRFGAMALVVISSAACSSAVPSQAKKEKGAGDSLAPGDDDATTPGGDGTTPPPATSRGKLGVIVIDAQQVFFTTATSRNPSSNIPARMANIQHVFELAAANQVPTFITYEQTKSGDHALPASLAAALPKQAQDFIKTTFAATSQLQFLPAVQASEVKRVLVVGAETDVCVLQTMLGLRRAGLEVLALADAIFTEEVNDGPARRRMRQAGVVEVKMQEAEDIVAKGAASTAPPASSPLSVRPLEIGIVLHDLAGLNAPDANAAAKKARLKELLLISEWFHMPVLAADPAAALAALPADLRAILKHPIVALTARPAQVKQLAVAGGRAGIDGVVTELAKNGDVFLLEDVLLGAGDLEPLFAKGAVPSTYKTLYYEMIQSVNDAQWPSPQWVTDSNPYFDLTKAPEELPPLTP